MTANYYVSVEYKVLACLVNHHNDLLLLPASFSVCSNANALLDYPYKHSPITYHSSSSYPVILVPEVISYLCVYLLTIIPYSRKIHKGKGFISFVPGT